MGQSDPLYILYTIERNGRYLADTITQATWVYDLRMARMWKDFDQAKAAAVTHGGEPTAVGLIELTPKGDS